ncbi:BpuSI family type II restriction endonuclease [Fundicoccus sp. Sow4_D5]|uniref:BpuSI family type II restriction endonuclease n=1 Tax=Fundicoccus sp. Sow4_D5 TaxID=3438782 RepID=UPI003F909B83
MRLPNYTDGEVISYHPLCEQALNKALIMLNIHDTYEVIHHENINGIIPDFVIKNKDTKKYLMFIEVKRTPDQVTSVRFKNQVQSYVLEAQKSRVEKPYYVLTNLEVTNFFKYDASNTSVNNQILEPSPIYNGSFEDEKETFKSNLINHFKNIITIALHDTGKYTLSYNEIVKTLAKYIKDEDLWHSAITVIGYEFIRSILIKQRPKEVSSWKNAILYKNNPKILQNVISKIDFKSLTMGEISDSNEDYWINKVLKEASNIGDKSMDGDEFAKLTHDLVIKGRESEGLVPTDEELGAVLVSLVVPRKEYSNNLKVSDPASGSGNLVSAFIDRYPHFPSENIWLNDKVKQFQDILTIRFGLKFSNIITPMTSPKITNFDIVNLNKEDFKDIDVILLNPPYVSGVSNKELKGPYFKKIQEVTNSKPLTQVGQIAVEGPFLELLLNLIEDDTKIGVVFPESHLIAKGREAIAIRKLLLQKFGLNKIFTYPRNGVFESVTKGTVILVGEKGRKVENIEIINSHVPVNEIDLLDLESELRCYGVSRRSISYSEYEEYIEVGWKGPIHNPEYMSKIEKIKPYTELIQEKKLRRGPIGNIGGTEYLFPTKQKNWDELKNLIPTQWLFAAIENTRDADELYLNMNTISTRLLNPPEEAFQEETEEFKVLNLILDIIEKNNVEAKGSQRKKVKTREEILKILKSSNKKITSQNTVLIPRNLRDNFKVYLLEEPMFVSSNFIELNNESKEEAEKIISWMYSIFGQIQLEFLSKPQEGARKMEKTEFSMLRIPSEKFGVNYNNKLPLSRKFIDFTNQNEIDEFWNSFLCFEQSDINELQEIISELINARNP